jgi:hypothetical protein
MQILLRMCALLVSVEAAMILSSSAANAVFWRGLSAPTNIDYHSPCQWIRVNGYWVRQCIR